MLRSARTVLLFGITVQFAAFLRTAIIAATLGSSRDVDAYNLCLVVPSFISAVVGSWLQLSFVGKYAALTTAAELTDAIIYRTRLLTIVLSGSLALAAVCFYLSAPLLSLFLSADNPETFALAAAALKLSGFVLIPTIVGDFLALVLNSHGRFLASSLAPLINALVSSIGLLLLPEPNVTGLIATLLIGSLSQCCIVLVALLMLPGPAFIWGTPPPGEVRKTLVLALPLLAATMFSNAVAALVQFHAASLGEGSVSLYGYASRLHGAIVQVLVIGFSTVLLPHFAILWSSNKRQEILVLFRRLARSTILVSTYAALGILVLGATATRALFQRGAFDEAHTQQVSWFWFLLSLSLFPAAFGTFIAKFCQAVRGALSILLSSTIAFISAWFIARLGASMGSLDIVILSISISQALVVLFWLAWLAGRIPVLPLFEDIGFSLLRTGLICAPAAGFAYCLGPYTRDWPVFADLLFRGAIYTAVAGLALVMSRSYRWYFKDQLPA